MKSIRIMPLLLAAIFGFGLTIDAVNAQPEKPGEKEQRGDRPNRRRRERPRPDHPRYKSAGERMKMIEAKVELDETQRSQIEEVLRVGDEKMKAVRDQMRPSEEEMEEMKALRQQFRDARDSGDQEAMDAAREAQRAFGERRRERMEASRATMLAEEAKMHDGIRAQLRDDQVEAFETVWSDITEYTERLQDRGARNARGMDARRMRRIVDGLKGLTPAQNKQIDEIFTEHRKKQREARREKGERRGDKDGEADPKEEPKRGKKGRRGERGRRGGAEVDALADAVMKVLNEEQVAEFQAELDKAKAKRERRAGGKGRGKGGRERDRRPPPPPGDDE